MIYISLEAHTHILDRVRKKAMTARTQTTSRIRSMPRIMKKRGFNIFLIIIIISINYLKKMFIIYFIIINAQPSLKRLFPGLPGGVKADPGHGKPLGNPGHDFV